MRRLLLGLTLLSFILLGCEGVNDSVDQPHNPEEICDSHYVIPVAEAIDNLKTFLESIGEPTTRCSGLDFDNVISIPHRGISTRSANEETPLLYALNFPDDGGYAILAADRRIDDEVLAVTEKGVITCDNFEPYCSYEPSDDDDIFENQYNEMSSAGYVGTYSEENFVAGLCYSYASYASIDTTFVDMPFPEPDSVDYNRWIVSKNVDCKLETIWNQGSPFNDLCPKVGWFKREKAPAGCVPIAVGQIVAYHEYPNLICNGVKIDYSLLKAVRNIHDVDNSEDSLGIAKNFIRFLSSRNACDVYYGKIFGISFGFALPSKAKSTFDLLGYNNVNLKWGYNENTVMKSLDSGCHVFMSAVAGIVDGHAWVIDGYKIRNYTSPEGRIDKTQNIVHCNWGWLGNSNGYFVSGIFKTNEGVSYDYSGTPQNEKYWYLFNTITYDKPVKTD